MLQPKPASPYLLIVFATCRRHRYRLPWTWRRSPMFVLSVSQLPSWRICTNKQTLRATHHRTSNLQMTYSWPTQRPLQDTLSAIVESLARSWAMMPLLEDKLSNSSTWHPRLFCPKFVPLSMQCTEQRLTPMHTQKPSKDSKKHAKSSTQC